MEPLSFAKSLEILVGIVIKRRIGKTSDSVILFLSGKNSNDELEKIRLKFHQIESTLERMEGKINASLLLPLQSGWLNLKDAQYLSNLSLKESALHQAYESFNKMIALPYNSEIGDMEINVARSLAYFGKASVLSALNEGVNLISENIVKGFFEDIMTSKMFLDEDVREEMLEKCNGGKARLSFKLLTNSTMNPKERERFTTIINIKVVRKGYGGSKDEEFKLDKVTLDNWGEGDVSIMLDSGTYEIIATADVNYYYSGIDGSYFSGRKDHDFDQVEIRKKCYLPISGSIGFLIWVELKDSGRIALPLFSDPREAFIDMEKN